MRRHLRIFLFLSLIPLSTVAQDTFYTYYSDGTVLTFPADGVDSVSVFSNALPEKCNASDYPQVTIGTQVWMAENYRCSRYDTESEAYNASWLTYNTLPTSLENLFTPYFMDTADSTTWSSDSKTLYTVDLTDAQIAKLGYQYNWAAAVGVENGQNQITEFTGNRQGICPNGWHIPTKAEWQTLYDYIYNDQSLSANEVGKYMKTTSGWYQSGNGTDSYGFAMLPAGAERSNAVQNVGFNGGFWAATPKPDHQSGVHCAHGRNAYCCYYNTHSKDVLNDYVFYSNSGLSVRCLKNP